MTADKEEYVQGDTIAVTSDTSYYFGGPVSDAAVRWSVLTEDRYFQWQGEGYYDFADQDYLRERRLFGPQGNVVSEGEGRTDAKGRFTFSVPADIAEMEVSQTFTIEVTVTDVNNQEVSARTSVAVHKGLFYVGVRPQSYVTTAGEAAGIDVITVDSASQPVARQRVALTFYEHRWYNVREKVDGGYQWKTSTEDIEVGKQTVATDGQGRATASFVPETPGTYKVLAESVDTAGNHVRASTYLWVTGDAYVSWAVQDDNTIQLVTDKKTYRVGDVARVLIPSPYQGKVAALFTSERGQVLDHQVIDVTSSSQVIEVPITEDYAPNVYFVAVLVRSEDEDASLPAFQVGYASAQVAIDALTLQLDVQPDRAGSYQPGEQATFTVTAKDHLGKPAQAELSLNLVDKSVLALATTTQPNIVDYFYSQRGLGVQTAVTLAISTENIGTTIASQGKGGGGGGNGGISSVRELFPETALWEPAVMTDENGQATVTVKLPDNLTTWQLEAKAVTADTLVAQGDTELLATKDLLVRPALPRFLTAGDTAMLGAIVHNNTKQSLSVEVSLDLEGLVAEAKPQQVTIEPGGRTRVTWEVSAVSAGEATVTISAKSGQYTDAVRQTLPVYAMTVAETVATSGQVEAGGTQVEGVTVPPRYLGGELSIGVEASLAASMIPGLDYLTHYPYECTEQTLSRFLPNVVTSRALRALGIDDSALTQGLAEQVAVGVQRLYAGQHDDGGWGWWFRDESDPYLSAYVVFGLTQAKAAGYSVDAAVIDRGVAFLTDALHRRPAAGSGRPTLSDDSKAYIVYVLAEAGEGDLGVCSEPVRKQGQASVIVAAPTCSWRWRF